MRIREAVIVPEDEVQFYEKSESPLSDRDLFLVLLDNPPELAEALRYLL